MNEVVQQETAVAVAADAFGSGDLSSEDIVIPKILVMQGLSKLVTDGAAKFGDFVENMSSEVIGHITDKPLEFIPFHRERLWIVSKKKGSRFEFDHIEPCNSINENKKWYDTDGKDEIKNEKAFNYYCILPSDPSIPYVIQFKSTSLKSGKELATQMYVKNKADGLLPPSKKMELWGDKVSNDKGTFAVLKWRLVGETSDDEIQNCLQWYNTINAGGTKVEEELKASSPKHTQGNDQF